LKVATSIARFAFTSLQEVLHTIRMRMIIIMADADHASANVENKMVNLKFDSSNLFQNP